MQYAHGDKHSCTARMWRQFFVFPGLIFFSPFLLFAMSPPLGADMFFWPFGYFKSIPTYHGVLIVTFFSLHSRQ